MKNFGFPNFILAFFLFCNNVKSVSSYTCFNDTAKLNAELLGPSPAGTYHICENAVIQVGVFDNERGYYVNGSQPVIMGFSGIKILCGEDGSIKNNCVFRGGDTAVEIVNPFFYISAPEEPAFINDLHIEGFTFTDLVLPILSVFQQLAQVGVTLKNCKFIDNVAQAIVQIQTSNPQQNDQITIVDSQFVNNTIFEPPQEGNAYAPIGVINGDYGALISVTNTTFSGNTFLAKTGVNIFSSPASAQGQTPGKVTVKNSCFVGNKGLTATQILMFHPISHITANHKDDNTFKNDGNLICDGVAYSLGPAESALCNLAGFDMPECSFFSATFGPTFVPTPAPTPAPTFAPTPAPFSPLTPAPTSAQIPAQTSASIFMSNKLRETIMILSSAFLMHLF